MDMIDQMEANGEFLKGYQAKSDDNRPVCLKGKRVQVYLKMLLKAKSVLKPPHPKIEVTDFFLLV